MQSSPRRSLVQLLIYLSLLYVVQGKDGCRDPSSDNQRAVMVGQSVCFVCPRGSANIEWKYNGAPVNLKPGLTDFPNGTLLIASVESDSIGHPFSCRNRNTGEQTSFSLTKTYLSSATTDVTVPNPSPRVTVINSIITAVNGVVLFCIIVLAIVAILLWRKRSQELKISRQINSPNSKGTTANTPSDPTSINVSLSENTVPMTINPSYQPVQWNSSTSEDEGPNSQGTAATISSDPIYTFVCSSFSDNTVPMTTIPSYQPVEWSTNDDKGLYDV